jgi:plasmid stabilization system protein ParE
MSDRVVIHDAARRDMDEYLTWLHPRAPTTVANWFERLQSHIFALPDNWMSCPLALENRRTSRELRESHFGKLPNVFRIIFYLEADAVHVIRVRRAQRRLLSRREIDDAIQDAPE